ncbi:MAG: hypothetical protein Q7R33_01665 [Nitrosarchaeum sp.]|nr:hypothetical protein [Nitrosarchaeum sp.]
MTNTIKNGVTAVDRRIHAIIAIVEIVFGFILFGILILFDVPEAKKDIVIYILGVVSAHIGQIISYYYGSSKGSDDKNQMLMNAQAPN